MNLLRGLEMETEKMSDFIALFHLVEYLEGFDNETIEAVMIDLENNLEHYMSKGNKTLRDKFEIVQTKFFIEEIDNVCNTISCKTSRELAKLFTAHLNVNYMEKRDEI